MSFQFFRKRLRRQWWSPQFSTDWMTTLLSSRQWWQLYAWAQ